MLYAILAYHVEDVVASWTPEEDKALMGDLLEVHDRFVQAGTFGPSARLDFTSTACTLRGSGAGVVTDGPFAETKEQLLGLYLVEVASREDAVAAARELHGVNQTAVYEIRPVALYVPGTPFFQAEVGKNAD